MTGAKVEEALGLPPGSVRLIGAVPPGAQEIYGAMLPGGARFWVPSEDSLHELAGLEDPLTEHLRKAGASRSQRKADAARLNGKLGGRPRKEAP